MPTPIKLSGRPRLRLASFHLGEMSPAAQRKPSATVYNVRNLPLPRGPHSMKKPRRFFQILSPRSLMDRRNFLKISGTALAGATVASALPVTRLSDLPTSAMGRTVLPLNRNARRARPRL
jgi:hypothetical protein